MHRVQKERRKYTRYKVTQDVLSVNQDVLAEVIDISECGISCQGLTYTAKPLATIIEIELLNCELGTSIDCLPCRIVRRSKKAIFDEFASTMIMNFSLEFTNLTSKQLKLLGQFIKDNSLSEVEMSTH